MEDTREDVVFGLSQNSMQAAHGSHGFSNPLTPLPPFLGNVNSGHGLYNNESLGSPNGLAAAKTPSLPPRVPTDRNSNPDNKKLKRVLASRQYSQKYRLKQIQHISELETEVKALQAEVAIKYPRIKYSYHQNSLLRAENNLIKQKIANFAGELMFKEAEYEELRKERDFLAQLFQAYQQQQIQQHQQQEQQQLQEPPMFDGACLENQQSGYHVGLNQPETTDYFMAPGESPMGNQNFVHFGDGDFTDTNSPNAGSSFNML